MKTYLVEDYSPDIEFDENSLIVALTPEVCYLLDKTGIKYSIIEDYYDETELLATEDEFYQTQLRWIDELDEFLQSNITELRDLNLRLGAIYYYFLKSMALDPIYIRCYTLKRLFEKIKPSGVVFVSCPPHEASLDFTSRGDGSSVYSQVTPILCRENDIPFAWVFLEEADKGLSEQKAVSGGSLSRRLRRSLGKNEIVRRIYFRLIFTYTYFRKRAFLKQPNREKLKIFILRSGSNIGTDFIIDALKNGHSIYQLSDDFVIKYSFLGVGKYLDLKTAFKDESPDASIWARTANLLEGSDLIKRINEQCQLDVSELILPKLKYFIAEVCPHIFRYFKVFNEFYEKERVDLVLAPVAWAPIEFAARAAANHRDDVNIVCICHGDDIFAGKFWRNLELQNSEILISSNTEAMQNYEYLDKANDGPTELYISPHRLSNVRRINHLRKKRETSIKKGRVIFLPTMLRGNYRRLDNHYPDNWYYKLQKALIEYFSTKKEYTFVWKGLPQSDGTYNPIPSFIKDNNFSNIEIATNPFVEHLLAADKVICDYPSTGFYEAVIAGVPTMSLYHKAFRVRKSALECFGNLLKSYSDIPEAVTHIDEFLNGDPESYKKTIEMGNESVLHILEKADR